MNAIASLPQEQRQVILLVGLEGMRYEEVAVILDVPVGTVRSRLSRGRDQLRRLMEMGDEDETRSQRAIDVAAAKAHRHRTAHAERRGLNLPEGRCGGPPPAPPRSRSRLGLVLHFSWLVRFRPGPQADIRGRRKTGFFMSPSLFR